MSKTTTEFVDGQTARDVIAEMCKGGGDVPLEVLFRSVLNSEPVSLLGDVPKETHDALWAAYRAWLREGLWLEGVKYLARPRPGQDPIEKLVEILEWRNEQTWMTEAECGGLPKAMFFIERGHSVSPAVAEACSICPVQEECRAAGAGQKFGVWAGEAFWKRRHAA